MCVLFDYLLCTKRTSCNYTVVFHHSVILQMSTQKELAIMFLLLVSTLVPNAVNGGALMPIVAASAPAATSALAPLLGVGGFLLAGIAASSRLNRGNRFGIRRPTLLNTLLGKK